MRILMFLHNFEPGGVERVALRLAGAWADGGQDVRVLIGRDCGPQRSIAPDNVSYDLAPASLLARWFETLWLVIQLVGAVRRHKPDVLFCAGSTYTIVAALARLLLGSMCPPVVCKLSNSLERRDLPVLVRAAYGLWLRIHPKFIDRFIGMAEPMSEEICRCLGVPPHRVAVIPDPALTVHDLRTLSAPSSTRGGPGRQFIAVGRLTRQKNFALLLQAFFMASAADDRLLIVGDGPERRRLARLAARLGIAARVDMPGHCGSVSEALNEADIFVSSSNYEGLPGVVVEALAAGLPIVATDCSACMGYLLSDGALGQLVPIRDVHALAHALRGAHRREDVPLAAMRAAAAQFTIERGAGLYLDAFASAVARCTPDPWVDPQPLREAA